MAEERQTKLEFVPSEFMRGRHPHLFSDSEVVPAPVLSRAVLEYHLDSLTARRQETEFETFCRQLAQRELCPNLRPQTGPVGGGDSKVDAENYPVADELAVRWFVGEQGAARERWAFAFSAKRDWKAKVKADVASILSTDRDYALIYFMTNQHARDKDRAALEDELAAEAGVPVRILDRNWIVERVFDHERFELLPAIGLTDLPQSHARTVGPNDAAREKELTELEAQIDDPDRYAGIPYALAEDCLEAAVLARGLGRPRVEVDGRFARAERIAEQVGSSKQRLRIAYAKAWTAFWWFNDADELSRLYDQVEALAADSSDASDLELVVNLFQLLPPTVARGKISPKAAKIAERRDKLTAELRAAAADQSRPGNALLARTYLLMLELSEVVKVGPKGAEPLWPEFRNLLQEAQAYAEYPVELLYRLVKELGSLFTDSPAFDQLFEEIVALIERRESEGAGGVAYLERAVQKLEAGRPMEAIRLFGRAEDRLLKEECQAELITALAGMSYAYETVGLPWAARNAALAAAERTLQPFRTSGVLAKPAPLALRRLMQAELRLGRLPQFLASAELEQVVRANVRISDAARQRAREDAENLDKLFGILLLRTPLAQLVHLERLPDRLWELDLEFSRVALLYALGHEQQLRDEGTIPAEETDDGVQEFFESWLTHPLGKEVSDTPELGTGEKVHLSSRVLGCEIKAIAAKEQGSIALAEALLGVLEAFLATSLAEPVMPFLERLELRIASNDGHQGPPTLTVVREGGAPAVQIAHAPTVEFGSADDLQDFARWLHDALATILTTFAVIDDAEGWLDRVAGDEKAFVRAITFSNMVVLTRNLFGRSQRLSVVEWSDGEAYPVQRTQPLSQAASAEASTAQKKPAFGVGPPPPEMMDPERLRHGDRRVLSVIDIPVWDRAKWSGTGFMWSEEPQTPPWLALLFRSREAGREIFTGWRARFGEVDEKDDLRIAIIRGISIKNPHAYSVVLGPQFRPADENTQFITVQRINRMEPTNSRNLDGFLARFRAVERFVLMPAHLRNMQQEPDFEPDLWLGKTSLEVREAWQIGDNDPDLTVIDLDDPPIIPTGVSDPPVLKAIERVRAFRKGSR